MFSVCVQVVYRVTCGEYVPLAVSNHASHSRTHLLVHTHTVSCARKDISGCVYVCVSCSVPVCMTCIRASTTYNVCTPCTHALAVCNVHACTPCTHALVVCNVCEYVPSVKYLNRQPLDVAAPPAQHTGPPGGPMTIMRCRNRASSMASTP